MDQCIYCHGNVEDLITYENIMKTIKCPHCDKDIILNYDESYDSESGEESQYWWWE